MGKRSDRWSTQGIPLLGDPLPARTVRARPGGAGMARAEQSRAELSRAVPGNFSAFNPSQDKQNIDEPVASIHLDPLLVSKMTSICSNLKFASFQIGTEGHYRVSPLGPALDLFDSMNNAGMSSNMSVGSINNYNGYGHESAYAPPHTMNQVHQELHE